MGRKAYSPEKRREMRESVLFAARDLFENEGRDAVTMRRVGKQLGMSAMALYGYFDGKEQLVGALLDEGFKKLERTMAAEGPADGFANFADESMGLLRWMLESGSEDQWRTVVDAVRQQDSAMAAGKLVGLGFLRVRGLLSHDEFLGALQGVQTRAAA